MTLAAVSLGMAASAQNRWTIEPDGKTIRMDVNERTIPHDDHVEMSGKYMAVVLYWDVDEDGIFGVDRSQPHPGKELPADHFRHKRFLSRLGRGGFRLRPAGVTQ